MMNSNPLIGSLEKRCRDGIVWTLINDGMTYEEAARIAQLLLPLIVPWIEQMEACIRIQADRVMSELVSRIKFDV